jgi:hypothetical protein
MPKKIKEQSKIVLTYKLSTQEAEVGGSGV